MLAMLMLAHMTVAVADMRTADIREFTNADSKFA